MQQRPAERGGDPRAQASHWTRSSVSSSSGPMPSIAAASALVDGDRERAGRVGVDDRLAGADVAEGAAVARSRASPPRHAMRSFVSPASPACSSSPAPGVELRLPKLSTVDDLRPAMRPSVARRQRQLELAPARRGRSASRPTRPAASERELRRDGREQVAAVEGRRHRLRAGAGRFGQVDRDRHAAGVFGRRPQQPVVGADEQRAVLAAQRERAALGADPGIDDRQVHGLRHVRQRVAAARALRPARRAPARRA